MTEVIQQARDVLAKLQSERTPGNWHWEPPKDSKWPIGDESLVSDAPNEPTVLYGWGYDASGIEGRAQDRALIAVTAGDPALLAAIDALLAQALSAPIITYSSREAADRIAAAIVAANERVNA